VLSSSCMQAHKDLLSVSSPVLNHLLESTGTNELPVSLGPRINSRQTAFTGHALRLCSCCCTQVKDTTTRQWHTILHQLYPGMGKHLLRDVLCSDCGDMHEQLALQLALH
jgi:hypothetical protein